MLVREDIESRDSEVRQWSVRSQLVSHRDPGLCVRG